MANQSINKALNTGSTLSDAGNNLTSTALSTQIVIRVGNVPIGAVKSLQITEARSISMVDELGTDGSIDSAPTSSTKISGSCERTRFDRLRITEAFARGFLHVKSQRIGFDIDIFDRWGYNDSDVVITTLKNVWINQLSYTYSADNWIISDSMQWQAEDIYSTINGGYAAQGGQRGIIAQTDTQNVERETDFGGRRGSMDAPGLLVDRLINLG